MAKSQIDFARAAVLMDVVQKVAGVAPAYSAISSAAMNELKEMNDVASEEHAELGRLRLKAEQEEAARLTQQAQDQADEQAKHDAKQKAIEDARNRQPVKPINVKPGEPDELEETKQRLAAQDSEINDEVRRI